MLKVLSLFRVESYLSHFDMCNKTINKKLIQNVSFNINVYMQEPPAVLIIVHKAK